ncbi:MAG: DUF1800 domain-containing protein [Chitinophagaceae bacterium]|nr:DUF1800 domain-containing protein [Chitinophagaceae bacterium]
MAVSLQMKNIHLLWRAGFGPRAEDIPQLDKKTPKDLLKEIFKSSSKSPQYINVASNILDGLVKGIQDAGKMQELTKEQKQQIKKQSREDLKNLNLRWMDEMVNNEAQLREKMALFWHGHFACREINIFFQQQLLDVIRRNALGNFGDLLREVSKSASMLAFLNNQQNRKQRPNENFAREVMELFTLGRGNYSEKDIKEAARAFTGWGFNLKGEFVFRKNLHDNGVKTVLGKTGDFDGDDLLDILLEQKQTAIFIAEKIYRYFVNENADKEKTRWLAARFYQSNYDIKKLMEDIFSSDWFYDDRNVGAKIKSPVELLAGIRRMLPMEFEKEEIQLLYQKLLGQVLFYPPNVAGWPGGKNWIDSSSLMYRLRLLQLLKDDDSFNATPKSDDDVMMGQMDMEAGLSKEQIEEKLRKRLKKQGLSDDEADKRVKVVMGNEKLLAAIQNKQQQKNGNTKAMVNVDIDWKVYNQYFMKLTRESLAQKISAVLLTAPFADFNVINTYTDSSSKENYIQTVTIQLMSTPEYQMC